MTENTVDLILYSIKMRDGQRRVVLVVAAFGVLACALIILNDLRGKPRAPSSSAPSDAGDTGKVAVLVYDEGQPLSDRWVVFHNPDGSVTAFVKSGADGKATSDVRPGGMITVVYGTSIHQLITVTGVQPRDEIVVGERDNDEAEAGDTATTADVRLPAQVPPPSTTHYRVSVGMGSTEVADAGASLRIPVLRRLVDKQRKFATLAFAIGADENKPPLAFAFSQADVNQDAGESKTSLPAWSTDWREQKIVLSSDPAEKPSKVRCTLTSMSGEARFDIGRVDAPFAGDVTTLRFAIPKPLENAGALLRFDFAYEDKADKALLIQRPKSLAPELKVNLRETLLPRVSHASIDQPSNARPKVRWQVARGGNQPDATVIQLAWPETREHVWTLIAPPTIAGGGSSGFEVPALPDVLKADRPNRQSPITVGVALIKASEYHGYDDVRRKGIHLMSESPEDEDDTVVSAVTGEVRF